MRQWSGSGRPWNSEGSCKIELEIRDMSKETVTEAIGVGELVHSKSIA